MDNGQTIDFNTYIYPVEMVRSKVDAEIANAPTGLGDVFYIGVSYVEYKSQVIQAVVDSDSNAFTRIYDTMNKTFTQWVSNSGGDVVPTNLSTTVNEDNIVVNNDNGTGVTLESASPTQAGLVTADDYNKIVVTEEMVKPIISNVVPTATDWDYPVGKNWIDSATAEVFVIVDNAEDQAVWIEVTGLDPTDLGSMAFQNSNNVEITGGSVEINGKSLSTNDFTDAQETVVNNLIDGNISTPNDNITLSPKNNVTSNKIIKAPMFSTPDYLVEGKMGWRVGDAPNGGVFQNITYSNSTTPAIQLGAGETLDSDRGLQLLDEDGNQVAGIGYISAIDAYQLGVTSTVGEVAGIVLQDNAPQILVQGASGVSFYADTTGTVMTKAGKFPTVQGTNGQVLTAGIDGQMSWVDNGIQQISSTSLTVGGDDTDTTIEVATATASSLGVVRPDEVSITVTDGVLSAITPTAISTDITPAYTIVGNSGFLPCDVEYNDNDSNTFVLSGARVGVGATTTVILPIYRDFGATNRQIPIKISLQCVNNGTTDLNLSKITGEVYVLKEAGNSYYAGNLDKTNQPIVAGGFKDIVLFDSWDAPFSFAGRVDSIAVKLVDFEGISDISSSNLYGINLVKEWQVLPSGQQ